VDQIPKLPNGKFDKRLLRATFGNGVQA